MRRLRHIVLSAVGFFYHFNRSIKYCGFNYWKGDASVRNFYSVLVYHALEKSLSFKNRRPKSGWQNAKRLLATLVAAQRNGEIGFHDRAGRSVLEQFLSLPENAGNNDAEVMRAAMRELTFSTQERHGAMQLTRSQLELGKLDKPEDFFFSRYSLREFGPATVPQELIARAVSLAIKTPSVCNRQPWSVYHTSKPEVRDLFLKYQSGNRSFGDKIPNLLIVTTDLRAFFGGQEHYQHWIDGGLFSMSLIYALHSLGVSTCALNWSQTPKNDKALRRLLNISPQHTIIMGIAAGYADELNKVCVSARRPLEEVLFELEERI